MAMATNNPTSPWRRILSPVLRILCVLLAIALLWYTVRHTGADLKGSLLDSAKGPLLVALLLYGAAQVLGAWRWSALLEVQGLRLSLWTALKLTLVGNFFSLLIPGSVTGDIIKIACAAQRYPGRAAEFTLVALVDRVIGLSGIFFAAAIATIAALEPLRAILQNDGHGAILLGVLAINAGCLGSLCLYLLYITSARWGKWRLVQSAAQVWERIAPASIRRIAARMNSALALYRGHQGALIKALAISVVIHLTVSGTVLGIGRALHETQMTAGQYVLTTQLSNVTGLLPLFPGGLGLRDAVSMQLFEAFQADPPGVRGAIPLVNSLILVFSGLTGALIYALSPAMQAVPRDAPDAALPPTPSKDTPES